MSIVDAFWMSIGASGRLVDLSRDECLELLGAMSVGRIAYTTDDGPRVLPVNDVLEGDSVVFRTVPDGEVYGPRAGHHLRVRDRRDRRVLPVRLERTGRRWPAPADRGGARPPPVRQDLQAVGGWPAQHVR